MEIDKQQLLKIVAGELRHAIHDHGNITPDKIGSAANRVAGGVAGYLSGYKPLPKTGRKSRPRSAHAKLTAVINGTLDGVSASLARAEPKYHANIIASVKKRLLGEVAKYELVEVRK